jgi:glutamate-1-semialdehyde aminotransferase
MIHVVLADCDCDREICTMPHSQISSVTASAAVTAMKRGLQNRGVDIMGRDAFLVSATHNETEIDQTIEVFADTMAAVRAEGLI